MKNGKTNEKVRSFILTQEQRAAVYNALSFSSPGGQGFTPEETKTRWPIIVKVLNDGWDDVDFKPIQENIDEKKPIVLKNSEWEKVKTSLKEARPTNLILGKKIELLIEEIKEVPLTELKEK